jgi:hypothetical protein
MTNDIEHEYTDEIVCPHCGYEHLDSWEYSDEGETECGDCCKPFSFCRNVAISYSTEAK